MTATTYATVFRLRGKALKAMFGRLNARRIGLRSLTSTRLRRAAG